MTPHRIQTEAIDYKITSVNIRAELTERDSKDTQVRHKSLSNTISQPLSALHVPSISYYEKNEFKM